jgi:hypothetical protein
LTFWSRTAFHGGRQVLLAASAQDNVDAVRHFQSAIQEESNEMDKSASPECIDRYHASLPIDA